MAKPLQPLLNDQVVVLRAPTQAWSAPDGSMGSAPIHGVYYGDERVLSGHALTVDGAAPEHIATHADGPSSVTFVGLLRRLDGAGADPDVRIELRREVTTSGVGETITVSSRLERPLSIDLRIEVVPDHMSMDVIKSGYSNASAGIQVEFDRGNGRWIPAADFGGLFSMHLDVPPGSHASAAWSARFADPTAVVREADGPASWSAPDRPGDDRLARWVDRALGDLDALRMTLVARPDDEFIAAGAPWFFTLFGRDSIWTARFLLPLGTGIAASTLRVLAALQGSKVDIETSEEPGKIMHELRRSETEVEQFRLPALYYGTVDATPLWITLLHDAWRWGMPRHEVEALLPNLERALAWMRDFGDADGDGLLKYIDTSGKGLANQGWKDSGDSVQWRDGALAEGPIALCEVQAYAYEAAMHGADLLDAFGRDGTPWRAWASTVRAAFDATFWIDDAAGAYPAIALDAAKRPVDTVTSNLGHLLGTGIVEGERAALVAARLGTPELDSGYGLRTMSTDSAGYWPLSYHGGSVWTHDTAIAITGLRSQGFDEVAGSLTEGLLRAAVGFDYRMPELHSGDSTMLVPYPAACRPQAWSAAASVALARSFREYPASGPVA
jgi:glycogen debranching enzyme